MDLGTLILTWAVPGIILGWLWGCRNWRRGYEEGFRAGENQAISAWYARDRGRVVREVVTYQPGGKVKRRVEEEVIIIGRN